MDMYNWDMVCAAKCSSINDKIANNRELFIKEFTFKSENNSLIEGEFDSWQIVSGGSSQRIHFITPIKKGKLTTTIVGEKLDIVVDGICPKIEIELEFVGNDVNHTILKINCKKLEKKQINVLSGDGSIVILDDDINNIFSNDEKFVSELFSDLMAKMIIENKEKLQFIFSELISLPDGNNTWMKSHIIQYSYNESINGELGVLGVLTILEANPNPPKLTDLQLQFDHNLVRKEDKSGFLIAKWAFIKYVLLEGLPHIFQGSHKEHFKIGENNIIHNNGRIPLNKMNGYTPYFDSALIEIISDKIIINNATGTCDVVSYSSYVSFSLSSQYKISLEYSNNRPRVKLISSSSPLFTSQAHDDVALIFWIFGGWVVDALIQGIRSQMSYLLWSFGNYGMEFDVFPISMNIDAKYKECGLSENFFMRS